MLYIGMRCRAGRHRIVAAMLLGAYMIRRHSGLVVFTTRADSATDYSDCRCPDPGCPLLWACSRAEVDQWTRDATALAISLYIQFHHDCVNTV